MRKLLFEFWIFSFIQSKQFSYPDATVHDFWLLFELSIYGFIQSNQFSYPDATVQDF